MTPKQKIQFNRMLFALKRIAKYQTTNQLRRDSENDYGLSYEETLEMAYENIQSEAKEGSKGIKLKCHYASDRSGEEQPPFEGFFRSGGSIMLGVKLKGWMPLPKLSNL